MLWTLLGGWFGSWALFALKIAPTAFEVLPSQADAGAMVAPVLATLHNYGVVAGLGLALIALLLGRGWPTALLPACLAALCLVSEYGVTPAISEVRPLSFGIDADAEAAMEFSELHETSRFLFGTIGFGLLGLIVLHARLEEDAPQRDTAPGARALHGGQPDS